MTGILSGDLPAGWRRCPSLGCGAPTGHDGAHVPEAVPPRPVAPAGRWVRRCTARSDCGRPAGHAPPCVPTRSDCTCGPYDPESRCTWCDGLVWQAAAVAAIDAAHAAGMLGDLPDGCIDCGEVECACHLPHVLDLEGIADTWPEQWRSLVEADPATLTAGGMRRRAAMLAIVAHVRGEQSARAERIEAAARALLSALDLCPCGQIVAADGAPIAALRAALCTCAAHGPDPACVEHGAALAKWQARNGT